MKNFKEYLEKLLLIVSVSFVMVLFCVVLSVMLGVLFIFVVFVFVLSPFITLFVTKDQILEYISTKKENNERSCTK
jgi:uncharacterized membrane protein